MVINLSTLTKSGMISTQEFKRIPKELIIKLMEQKAEIAPKLETLFLRINAKLRPTQANVNALADSVAKHPVDKFVRRTEEILADHVTRVGSNMNTAELLQSMSKTKINPPKTPEEIEAGKKILAARLRCVKGPAPVITRPWD